MTSVRAAVVAAACAVAAMTVVAGAVSWYFYARIESLLMTVAQERSTTLALALRLAETANRFAAGGSEVEAATNQLQRQNATVALAQHAQGLHEAIAALRRVDPAAAQMEAIERLVVAMEENLYEMNRLVERRIDLEALERRNRAAIARAQAELDGLWSRPDRNDPGLHPPEAAAVGLMLRLYEAAQADRPGALSAARAAYDAARAGPFALPSRIDSLATGPSGVFAVREAMLDVRGAIDRHAVQGREIVTRLGIAVSRLVATVDGEIEAIRADAAAQTAAGRRWLLAVAVLTFVGPLAFVWLAVSRSIVTPLARLAATTRAIAAGATDTPIPPAGHSEFHEIAAALAVFRDTTAALAERTRALAASEEAQRLAREEAERALADLRETQEQLIHAEKLAALAGVVAGVAHEVNTPVGITLTGASLLDEELAELDRRVRDGGLRRSDLAQFLDRAREIAGLIQANMNRAAALIQAFKQVAADRSGESRRAFDLRETVEQTVLSVKPAFEKAGHAIRVDCPPGLVLDGFPGGLSQILTILAMNALDHAFTPGHGGTLRISAAASGLDGIRIDVRDDGCGIPADLRRRVFEPFFTTRRANGNTGLGLHIAFNVAQQTLGGRLDLVGTDGGGAHFTLSIPAVAPRGTATDGAREPATATSSMEW